jgi:hypothetical protein
VSDRHQVLRDEQFWLKLEYVLCGWFRACGDRSLGGFWCDGVIPEFAADTREGIEVTGIAWIVENRKQHKCSFTASIPQRMLARRRDEFVITDLALDLDHKKLAFTVAPAAVAGVDGIPGESR